MINPWWAEAVVYEVYPRSFADSDADGIGDLAGVRSRIPYLADLGVNAIWLTPFYPSPLADGGYDVSDYCDVDPRLGSMADFDGLVAAAAAHEIRVIVDIVPNHCSSAHPYFRAALAAGPGSAERDRFIFRAGRGPDGSLPPNNWLSMFGGSAWTRVTDPEPGQWYLHLFDTSQPDWNWRNPEIPAYFEKVIRFWMDRGAAGLRVDVAHGLFKDPELADAADPKPGDRPSGYFHRPELQDLYRSWRTILDSYPAAEFPGRRTAVGEVWYDSPATLRPYLADGGLPQVFNFQLIMARWDAASLRRGIDAALALTGGSRAPWVIGNHDVPRPVSRYAVSAARGASVRGTLTSTDLVADELAGDWAGLETGARRARAAALLLLALPGSAYIYQGEELGLPEVLDIPAAARADPTFWRTEGRVIGRDGCRVPLPWGAEGTSFGFSGSAAPWLPQPEDWGRYAVSAQLGDPSSFLTLYRSALALRRSLPALGAGEITWSDGSPGTLCFTRSPGFTFIANLSDAPVPLPAHREILLASGPVSDGKLASDTAAWLATLASGNLNSRLHLVRSAHGQGQGPAQARHGR
jgi:alpha-glucosidase